MGVYLRVDEPMPDYLCFTANAAGSTISLNKYQTPTDVSLETSTDGTNWSSYTFWTTITLSNVGDKVYWRNTSETTTTFSTDQYLYYYFSMTWSIAASGDITSLINKNLTTTLNWDYTFLNLFNWCTSLTSTPKLPATTITSYCYYQMFYWCSSLVTLTELPATTVYNYCYFNMFRDCTNLEQIAKLPALDSSPNYCYNSMFRNCSKIKLSTTQTGEYQTEYRIPTTWTWTTSTNGTRYIFNNTWWSWAWTPSINTTYYTSNTVV